VKPFANEDEYKKTEEIVQKFQEGAGKRLHQKLLERARGKRNWVFILIIENLIFKGDLECAWALCLC
jgi:hypothetical protein